MRRVTRRIASLAALALAAAVPASLHAQRADSARVGPAQAPPPDTVPLALLRPTSLPPVSPKRALFQSLIVPGWGQSSLDRGTAGAIFVTVEAISIAMLVQAKTELRAAQNAEKHLLWDPGTGTFVDNPLTQVVGRRQAAVEDWAVLLVFNHLISAADAFVAAQLWNVPLEVSGSPAQKQVVISSHFAW
jgi:hypothetical protein